MHARAYSCVVEFEWDPRKAVANRRKHGIDFADAATVLHDELAVTVFDDDFAATRRFRAKTVSATL